jgi:hypothetical protein
MPRLYCREGKHEVKVGSQRHGGERNCPDHPDCELRPLPKKKNTRSAIKSTVAYQRAVSSFNAAVCRERCFFADDDQEGNPRRPGHRCRFPLEGHHLVSKDWIFQTFGDLPLPELLAILFDPRIGAPLCRTSHDLVEYSTAPDACIYFEELRFECVEFCEAIDAKYPGRPSMLERLKLENPERVAA